MDTNTSEPLIWHKSACNLCYINCGVELAGKPAIVRPGCNRSRCAWRCRLARR